MGEEMALAIYLKLVAYTRSIADPLECDKAVFYSDQVDTEDSWSNELYQKVKQSGDDLGERMSNAFDWAFKKGYESVCMIGSDCLDLTTEQIENGLEILSVNDVVIGPARDGGYYFIGMDLFRKELFINKPWGSHLLLEATLDNLEKENLLYQLLPVLKDIDLEEDLPKSFRVATVNN
jgi:rSAM/selenodomain-associated transferase 1